MLRNMDNRRENYRHSFSGSEALPAECEMGGKTMRGAILDLSIGGMKLRIEQSVGLILPGQTLRVRFKLPTDTPVAVEGVVVHGPHADNPTMGIRFLSLADKSENDERNKVIWAFLLSEQWKLRRRGLAQLHG